MNENKELCPFVQVIFLLYKKKFIKQKHEENYEFDILRALMVCVLVDFDGLSSTSGT